MEIFESKALFKKKNSFSEFDDSVQYNIRLFRH